MKRILMLLIMVAGLHCAVAAVFEGRVFLDANRNGEYDAGEAGMADVVVSDSESVCSNCWSTGSGWRDAKVSAGNSRSGTLLTVAVAAAVTILAEPGPIEEAHAMILRRLLVFA